MQFKHLDIKRLNNKKHTIHKIKYVFSFVSLITPHKLTNLRLFNVNNNFNLTKKYKKLFVKQSYLLMTWVWYIQQKHNQSKKPSFVFKPKQISKLTLLKSPMAHKTFSQEQFQFKYYTLLISFTIDWTSVQHLNVNQSLFLLLNLKNQIPFVETNFFFLKKFTLLIPSSASNFLLL